MPLKKERLRRALLGAACGFLLATALVAANLPLLPGANLNATVLATTALGAIIALAFPGRWIGAFAVVVAVVVFALAFTPLMAGPVHSWVRRDAKPARSPDAVVVLSTTISADGFLDATGTTRLLSGLEAMRETGARMLVTTRPSQTPDDAQVAATQDYQRLLSLVVDKSRWRVVGPVATTHDEALATSRLLAPAASRSIVVVTSPLHARRACGTFEAVGFAVTCWPADERRYALFNFNGIRTRLAATADWVYERAAMVEYRWRGWSR